MPNWCQGALEVRGRKEDIKSFLLDNFDGDNKEIFEDENKLFICSNGRFYIEGTARNFIDDDIMVDFDNEETIKECILKFSWPRGLLMVNLINSYLKNMMLI